VLVPKPKVIDSPFKILCLDLHTQKVQTPWMNSEVWHRDYKVYLKI